LATGLCTVVAALPVENQAGCFESIAACLVDSFETMVTALRVSEGSPTFDSGLSTLAGVLSTMASLPGVIATASTLSSSFMQSGCETSPDEQSMIPQTVVFTLDRAWSSLDFVCESYCRNDVRFSISILTLKQLECPNSSPH
jgi:hypothetical protein